jgi:phosphatidylethanolamine-binding protein
MKHQPKVTWNDVDRNFYYTLIMVDPDAPSRQKPKFREWQHWLIVNIPGDKINEGEVKSEYIGKRRLLFNKFCSNYLS